MTAIFFPLKTSTSSPAFFFALSSAARSINAPISSGVPVWNGLTNEFHPTQILADFLTLKEKFGKLEGLSGSPIDTHTSV